MPIERLLLAGCVPGAFFQIERLIDRTVYVEHEVDAQAALVVQDLEADLARAADVVVKDELIDDVAQLIDRPATRRGHAQSTPVVSGGSRPFIRRL